MPRKHGVVALGGTFDHFHDGHRHFLNFAAERGQQLQIGITNSRLIQNKPYLELVEPFLVRKKSVYNFCKRHRIQAAFVELNDIYGTTLEDEKINALIVTEETVIGAKKINDAREAMGLKRLPVYVCSMLVDENGQPLHADAIRAGKVNRQGQVYLNLFKSDLKLNDSQRKFFSELQGEVVEQAFKPEPHQLVCVVGDTSLEKFIKNGWSYDLGIYDGKCKRKDYKSPQLENIIAELTTDNQAGSIQTQLIKTLQQALKNKAKHIFVNGEEDLAAVALVLLLPLDSLVYYGQPDDGLVCLLITEQLKEKFYQIFNKLSPNLSQN